MFTRRQVGGGVILMGLAGCNSLTNASGTGEKNEDSKRLIGASNGSQEQVLVRHRHIAQVRGVLDEEKNNGRYAVSVEFTAEGEDSFYDGMEELNAADNPGDIELYTYHDGEVVFTSGITAAVAERPDPQADSSIFRVPVPNRETAEDLEEDLKSDSETK